MRLEGRVHMCALPCWPPRASAAGMVPGERLAMPDFFHEVFHDGPVAGVDEAGRGPLAGPVVAAAVILDRRAVPDGLNDSKQLAPARRAVLEVEIRQTALCFGIGVCTVEDIDELNIFWATMLAMRRAVEALERDCAHILVDGNRCPDWPDRKSTRLNSSH